MSRSPETVARDAEAARLRARGWTYPRIAEHFGVTKQAVHQMVQRVMAETLREPAEQVREYELDRLDELEYEIRREIEAGATSHTDASDKLLRIFESRRKLLGLDAASKLDVSGGVTYEVIGVPGDAL